jgi:hypothetical protein
MWVFADNIDHDVRVTALKLRNFFIHGLGLIPIRRWACLAQAASWADLCSA